MARPAVLMLLAAGACAPLLERPPPPAPSNAPASSTASKTSTVAAVPRSEPAQPSSFEAESVEDDVDIDALPGPTSSQPRVHPLDDLDFAELERRLEDDPESLGSITIGQPSAGALLNAVQMPEGDDWVLVDPGHAWGTRETVDYLTASIGAVYAHFPSSHPLYIGHISARRGGPLSPHISHQSGRDVDISYFYTDEKSARWYARAHARNLDRARTWAFVRALVTMTDVELILIDHSIQKLLEEHALAIGEEPSWVASLFRGVPGKLRPLILHAKGHATHLHVRFYNPIAQETAHRAYELLVARGLVKPPTRFVKHRVKKGETLGMLAKKYGCTVPAIRDANGIRGNLIRAGREYRIPKRSGVAAPPEPSIPERRLPPNLGSPTGAGSSASRSAP